MSDADEISWELLSYFALDPERQRQLIGNAEQWFCREDEKINPGANYLLGLVYSFSSYRNVIADSADIENAKPLLELDALLNLMLSDSNNYYWTVNQLFESSVWQRVRELAGMVLDRAGLEINPPSKPFSIPELLEVDGYSMRDLPSGKS